MGGDRPWEPEPLEAEDFHAEGEVNINRAPPDVVGGVLYKRAALIKRVRYVPMEEAPSMPEAWRGGGETIARWLMSEAEGSAEGHLRGARFHRLLDLQLAAGASTGQQAHPVARLFYVLSGEGRLYHRLEPGAPLVARPLRPGDLALVRAGTWHSVAQEGEAAPLRLLLLEVEER